MQEFHQDNNENQPQDSCPHIGMRYDPATYSAFPSQMNACHHVQPINTPTLPHQRGYCLQADHINCPIFVAEPGEKMPQEIRLKTQRWQINSKRYVIIGGILLVLIAFASWSLFGSQWFARYFGPSASLQSQPEQTARPAEMMITKTDVQQTVTQTTIIFSEPLPTETQPTPTPTKERSLLALDTPIGDKYQFVIHRVATGESLLIFADQYNTSVEAITAVNFDLIAPLWIDWLVIIPVDITDVINLPSFEAHNVEEEQISLKALAEQLSASLEGMMLYNDLEEDFLLKKGDWVLVPREMTEP